MNKAATHKVTAVRLPQLAALMVVFLGLSTNTHLDATAAFPLPTILLPHPLVTQVKPAMTPAVDGNDFVHVLSTKDAALYRDAFEFQEKGDWKAADESLSQIKDKKLVGHVLADRYLSRAMSLNEAQQWMSIYADLPEANAIYDKARALHGFTTAHLAAPHIGDSWEGNNGSSISSGFRGDNDTSGHSRIDNRINTALHHGDPLGARELLATELQRGTLTIGEANEITSRIAAAFFYEGQTERARPLAHTAATSGIPLGLWIDGLSAWKQQDYTAASRSFASLAQAPGLASWDRAAASYWAYRAAKHTNDEVQAHHWLTEASKYPRSFYGYMALSQLGHAPARSWKMPELNAKNIDTLSQQPSGWQALALVQVGKTNLAESELRHLSSSGQRDLQTAILALAEKAQMPSLTLQLGGVVTNTNGPIYEAALYPVPPWQPTDGFKVDRALLFALMKHESQFDPDAVSDRGACGLMQIMPSTAREIANDNYKPGHSCPDRLFDPATNMELGQKYVRVLAGQPMIGDNLLLLLAAYNGGPGNLSHWLDSSDRADPLLFVETLPVRETRDYVQQVLFQYWVYRDRLAEPSTSVAQLVRGEWPRYALRDNGIQHADVKTVLQNVELASVDPLRFNGTR